MTREETLSQYKVDARSIIRSPGKFEGEMVFVPHFWEMALDGFSDHDEILEDDTQVSVFMLDKEDYKTWPELRAFTILRIWEDSQGFVHTEKI